MAPKAQLQRTNNPIAGVRPLLEKDVPQIVDLYGQVLAGPSKDDPQRRYQSFRQLYFDSPFGDPEIQPLVHEESSGRITGFLGVLPQPVLFRRRPLRCATSAHFCVHPDSRGLAGARLLTTFLDGPQDVSISDESNSVSRKLFELVGGSTSLFSSLGWTLPLKPVQVALHLFTRRFSIPSGLSSVLKPPASLLDRIAPKLGRSFLGQDAGLIAEPLDPAALLQCQSELYEERILSPSYTENSLGWKLDRLAAMRRQGNLEGIVLRSPDRQIAGWYLYFSVRGGIGQVLQIVSRPRMADGVIQHLTQHASARGVISLTGQMTRELYEPLFKRFCIVRHNCWMLVHSRHPELLEMFHRGETRLSRLEGELCQRLE